MIVSILTAMCGTLVLLLAIVWATHFLRTRLAERRFFRQYSGKRVLVCSRRGVWYDFIRNNVVPVLEPDVEVVWTEEIRYGQDHLPVLLRLLARTHRHTLSKPYLVHVEGRALTVVNLHDHLQPLTSSAARSADARQRVRAVLTPYGIVSG
jgi:hypothetical protein